MTFLAWLVFMYLLYRGFFPKHKKNLHHRKYKKRDSFYQSMDAVEETHRKAEEYFSTGGYVALTNKGVKKSLEENKKTIEEIIKPFQEKK
jgi:hypothetical protein